jgi:XTP/dITP diphosphohydrolase
VTTPPPARVVLASRNAKKIGEMRGLLEPFGIVVTSVAEHRLPDGSELPDVVEDGDTFAANAAKKAREIARQLSMWTIGEDSGLCVPALGGAPGVYSARYAADGDGNASDAANNAKLIAALADFVGEKRAAFYTCHVALADPTGEIRLTVEARCHGRIARDPRGENGFGYDPYFLLPEYGRTFGELSPLVKRCLSHRARAFERFVPRVVRLLAADE